MSVFLICYPVWEADNATWNRWTEGNDVQFRVQIHCDNDAFRSKRGAGNVEIARILRKVATGIEAGEDYQTETVTLLDVNGQECGRAKLFVGK
jgi:hypothetical protein